MTKEVKFETNGRKCFEGKEYPECDCNECCENIIEYDGYRRGGVYTYSYINTKSEKKQMRIMIRSLSPNDNSPTIPGATAFVERYNPENQLDANNVIGPVFLTNLS